MNAEFVKPSGSFDELRISKVARFQSSDTLIDHCSNTHGLRVDLFDVWRFTVGSDVEFNLNLFHLIVIVAYKLLYLKKNRLKYILDIRS